MPTCLEGNYRGHHYDKYPSSVSIADRIVDEAREKELVRGLAHYIHEGFESSIEFNANNRHTAKAKAIIENSNKAKNIAPSLNDKHPRAIISNAVSKGYIENFRLNEPWHPAIFRDPSRPTTYPFQHSTSIWYRGEEATIWFKEEVCDRLAKERGLDKFYNHKSVFNSGKLNPGSFHVKDQHLKKDQEFKGNSTLSTYWTTDKGGKEGFASDYSGFGGVVEAQIPSKWLEIAISGYGNIDSLEKTERAFKSPENFRKEFEDNFIEAKVTRQSLPLEYIKGVWPDWKFDEPYFLTLEEFHKLIYQRYPHKIPRNPKQINSKITTDNREERRLLEKELGLVEGLQKKLRDAKNQKELYNILHLYQQNSMAIIDEKRELEEGLQGINDRNQELNQISQELQTYFTIEPEYRKIENPRKLVELLIEDYEGSETGIISICEEVRTELEEVKAEMLKREKQGAETILSSKLKKYVLSEISRIPKIQVGKKELIRILEPKLDFDPRKEGLV